MLELIKKALNNKIKNNKIIIMWEFIELITII